MTPDPESAADIKRHNRVVRALWLGFGFFCLAAGIAGIILPLVPTTPFLLLAAFAFARGSTKVHDWLVGHPRLGPPIADWREHGAISRRVKWLSAAAIVAIFAISVALAVPLYALAIQGTVLAGVAIFIWTRPSPPPNAAS